MRIGFIDTIDKDSSGNGPNVAIAALSGYLAGNGHQVGILDLFHSPRNEQDKFFASPWDLIGVSASSFDFKVGLDAAVRIRRRTRAPVVFGGPHASVARGDILGEPAIDYAIYGEGEMPLLELADLLEKDRQPAASRLKEIRGLIFRDGRDVIVNPPQPRITDLDALPRPAYSCFPMEKYSRHYISTSRGCPFSCVFCASGAILGKKWIGRSPGNIVEEIEYLFREFGRKPVVIVDDTFNLDIARVKAFCRILIERNLGISWILMAGIRADRTDLEMLRLMKESGCRDIGIGIESSSPAVLENVAKGETIEDIGRGISLIKQAGFRVIGSFMIGNPGDTLERVKASFEYARSRELDEVYVYHAMPFPHTRLWEYVVKNGRFLRTDYVNFDKYIGEPVFETPEFPRADRVEAYRMALEAFPSLRAAVASKDRVGGPLRQRIGHYARAFIEEVHEHGYRAAIRKTSSFIAHRVESKISRIGTRISPS